MPLFFTKKENKIFNKIFRIGYFKTKIKSNTTKSGITFLIYKKIIYKNKTFIFCAIINKKITL